MSDNDLRPQQRDATSDLLRQLLDDDLEQHLTYEQLEHLVDGRLSPDDGAIVRAHVSQCVTCRADLTHLRDIAAQVRGVDDGVEAPVAIPPSPRPERSESWFTRILAFLPSAARPAYAMVAMALLLGITAGGLGLRLRDERRAAAERERAWSDERQAARANIERLTQELEQRQAAAAVKPPQVPGQNALVAFALTPGVFRGSKAPQLELPPGANTVRLLLSTDLEVRAPAFQAIIRLGTGREVWRTRWSRVGGASTSSVEVTIPAALLTPGQYVLEWSAQETPDRFRPLDDYAFTVVRR